MKVKHNRAAYKAILADPKSIEEPTRKVGEAAGEGYEWAANPGTRGRARGGIWTASGEAIRDNAENNTLIRALGNG